MTLDIAIATYKPEGIERVNKMISLWPEREGVRYVVSWQEHEGAEIPETLMTRKDVEIFRLNEKGVSNNRNNAIENCKGDIVLIADDDLEYEKDAFEKIISTFEKNPGLDLATFKFRYPKEKIYPVTDCRLTLPFPKYYYGSNVEIAFRRKRLKDLRYWPGIGLGVEDISTGEDEFFLISAIRRGFECRFVNKFIGSHPGETTGDRVSPGILRGQGFLIKTIYPRSYLLRVPLKAYRVSLAKKISFAKALRYLWKGTAICNKKLKGIPSNYRW